MKPLGPVLVTLLALSVQTVQAVTCQNNLPASNPDTAYIVHAGNGTATDSRTGLMWKVCAEGQSWSGGTCVNSATAHTWAAALALAEGATDAGYNDWRLPNLKELRSLVEECRVGPSINDTVFPATPSSIFWSGSPYVDSVYGAWGVGFSDGYAYGNNRNDAGSIRLVRGGQGSRATYNLANDFSATSNPNGAWSYGRAASLGQPFQINTGSSTGSNGALDIWLPTVGAVYPDVYPYILHNRTATEVSASSAIYAPNAVVMHPGSVGEVGIARWTSPASGTYTVSASFGGAEAGLTNVLVLKNGGGLFQGVKSTVDPYLLSPIAWNGVVSVSAGDTLDFVVGNGGDGYGHDSTRVDVTITECPSCVSGSFIFDEQFDGAALDGSKWVVSSTGGNMAQLSFSGGRMIVDNPGGSNGNSGITDGSYFTPVGVGMTGDYEVTVGFEELLRQRNGGYQDNSGIALAAGDVSILVRGDFENPSGRNVHRLWAGGPSGNCFYDDQLLTVGTLYSLEFKISRLGSSVTVGYRIGGGPWVKFPCGMQSGTVVPRFNSASGDGGGTLVNGRFVAAIDYFRLSNSPSSEVSPTSARVDVFQQFTVTGSGFTASTQFAIENCDGATAPVLTGTTQATFSCYPRRPGPAALKINGAVVAGATVFVDHPTRTGEPASRGIPAVKGVTLWNGNYHHQVVDMEVPALGVPFTVSRSYNSYHWGYENRRGAVDNYHPWRFNWEVGIGYVVKEDDQVDYSRIFVQREDGSGAVYFQDGSAWTPMDQGNFDQLKVDAQTGQTTLLTRAGLKYVFENAPNGQLIGIYDHDGHGLTVVRNANGDIDHVTDATNRAYTFAYDGNSGRLLSVTDFTGRKVEYTWEVDNPPNFPTADPPLRSRIKTVKGVRHTDAVPIVTTYNYTAYGPDTAPRVFLTSIVDANNYNIGSPTSAVTLTYTNDVYGNWGVASLTDAANSTWSFNYCAEQDANGTCDANAIYKAISFRTDVTAPLADMSFKAHFDTAGRYTGKTDQLAQATPRRNTVIPYPLASLTAQNYNFAGLTEGSKTPMNHQTGYTYHGSGSVATRTQPDGGKREVKGWQDVAQANNLYLPTESWSAACADATQTCVKQYGTFDAAGKPLNRRVGSLPATTHEYHPNALLKKTTDPLGKFIEFAYNAHGYLATTRNTLPGNDIHETVYETDPLGRVTARIDPRGVRTETTYDAAGNVLTETVDPGTPPAQLNLRTLYGYDANGNQVSRTDPKGNVVFTDYDPLNRPVQVRRTVNGTTVTTKTEYDVLGRVWRTTNANLHAQTTAYDDAGNVRSRSDALPRTTSYTYDADNRIETETDPEGRITRYEHDEMGRVTKVTSPDGFYTRSEYDKDGRVIHQFDKNNQPTTYGYDDAGRRISVTDAKNAVTSMSYWDNGLLKTVTDPNQHVTSYEYDDLGRRTKITGPAPASRTWLTEHDKSGNVHRTTDPDGRTATYTYDAANRLTDIAWSDGLNVHYDLDSNGNRKAVTDNTGTTTYTYDEMDRVKTVTDPNGQTVTYTWDGVGNLVTLRYPGTPGTRDVTYQYDAVERLWKMTDWASRSTTWTLDRSDRITQVAYPGGVLTSQGYVGGRLMSQATKKADNSVIASWNLTRDHVGNITNAAVQLPLLPAIATGTVNRSYDADNRQGGITYDAAGRITNNGAHTFAWNARDQITAIDGNAQTYNAEGMRVAQTVGGVTTRFVMDRAGRLPSVLLDADAANVPQRYYLHSPYGLVEQIDAAGNPRWYHYDTNGNTVALTNASGQVTDSYAYTPFGETTASGTTANPFRFVGQYGVRNFNNSELYDMRARWYSAEQARFLSLDPLLGQADRPQSLDRYAYVVGNPVRGTDPSGLYWWEESSHVFDEVYDAYQEYNEIIETAGYGDDWWGQFSKTLAKEVNFAWAGYQWAVQNIKVGFLNAGKTMFASAKLYGNYFAGNGQGLSLTDFSNSSYDKYRQQFESSGDCMEMAYDAATYVDGLKDLYKLDKKMLNGGQYSAAWIKKNGELGKKAKLLWDSSKAVKDSYALSDSISTKYERIKSSCATLLYSIVSQ
jgi:RHS repeat-associated protein